MLYRPFLHFFLVALLFAYIGSAYGQTEPPMTKSQIFRALEAVRDSQELLDRTNRELAQAVAARGVDFVLTPEEEWSLQLRDASADLLTAIRNAIDPKDRENKLFIAKQQGLYNTFTSNYNREELGSKRAALDAGREFVSLYGSDANVAELVAFIRRTIPNLERSVGFLERREEMIRRAQEASLQRMNAGRPNTNAGNVNANGQQNTDQSGSRRRRPEATSTGAGSTQPTQTQTNVPVVVVPGGVAPPKKEDN